MNNDKLKNQVKNFYLKIIFFFKYLKRNRKDFYKHLFTFISLTLLFINTISFSSIYLMKFEDLHHKEMPGESILWFDSPSINSWKPSDINKMLNKIIAKQDIPRINGFTAFSRVNYENSSIFHHSKLLLSNTKLTFSFYNFSDSLYQKTEINNYLKLKDGNYPDNENQILLTSSIAQYFNISLYDQISVLVPNSNSSSYKVSGIVDLDNMDDSKYKSILDQSSFTCYFVGNLDTFVRKSNLSVTDFHYRFSFKFTNFPIFNLKSYLATVERLQNSFQIELNKMSNNTIRFVPQIPGENALYEFYNKSLYGFLKIFIPQIVFIGLLFLIRNYLTKDSLNEEKSQLGFFFSLKNLNQYKFFDEILLDFLIFLLAFGFSFSLASFWFRIYNNLSMYIKWSFIFTSFGILLLYDTIFLILSSQRKYRKTNNKKSSDIKMQRFLHGLYIFIILIIFIPIGGFLINWFFSKEQITNSFLLSNWVNINSNLGYFLILLFPILVTFIVVVLFGKKVILVLLKIKPMSNGILNKKEFFNGFVQKYQKIIVLVCLISSLFISSFSFLLIENKFNMLNDKYLTNLAIGGDYKLISESNTFINTQNLSCEYSLMTSMVFFYEINHKEIQNSGLASILMVNPDNYSKVLNEESKKYYNLKLKELFENIYEENDIIAPTYLYYSSGLRTGDIITFYPTTYSLETHFWEISKDNLNYSYRVVGFYDYFPGIEIRDEKLNTLPSSEFLFFKFISFQKTPLYISSLSSSILLLKEENNTINDIQLIKMNSVGSARIEEFSLSKELLDLDKGLTSYYQEITFLNVFYYFSILFFLIQAHSIFFTNELKGLLKSLAIFNFSIKKIKTIYSSILNSIHFSAISISIFSLLGSYTMLYFEKPTDYYYVKPKSDINFLIDIGLIFIIFIIISLISTRYFIIRKLNSKNKLNLEKIDPEQTSLSYQFF